MKKIILFILINSFILSILCIIYFNSDSMKNNLIKIGYNKDDADKILEVFGDDLSCLENNYIEDINKIMNYKDFDSSKKCDYISYILKNNVNYDRAIEMVNADLNNYDYSDELYNIKNDNYFIKENTDRYINYLKNNNELNIREIVSSVNANIDYGYYNNINISNNQDSLLVIVNKFYSLNKDFVPNNLVSVSPNYGYGYVDKTLYENFKLMADDARKNGLNIYIASGYRSYDYQNVLYNQYVSRDGKENADTYSARPGHSEHQTGLAIDLNDISDTFGNTNEFKWLSENAYKYGFILRYPKDYINLTGYVYEPWHYRYVGLEVSKYIYENNITFDEYYEYFLAD